MFYHLSKFLSSTYDAEDNTKSGISYRDVAFASKVQKFISSNFSFNKKRLFKAKLKKMK